MAHSVAHEEVAHLQSAIVGVGVAVAIAIGGHIDTGPDCDTDSDAELMSSWFSFRDRRDTDGMLSRRRRVRSRADTRGRILGLLKTGGPADARTLAARLKVSPMAVRHHLHALRAEDAVSYREELRPFGRPVKMWELREPADTHFPDAHAELSAALLRILRIEFGQKRLRSVLAAWARERGNTLMKRRRSRASFVSRLKAVLADQTRQGFLPRSRIWEDGSILLELNHCPIRTAAASCQELCEAEREFLHMSLGGGLDIRRMECVLTGARNCVYRVYGPGIRTAE